MRRNANTPDATRMLTLGCAKTLSKLGQAGRVKIVEREADKNTMIGGYRVSIRQHAAHFVIGTTIIAIVVAAIGIAERVRSEIHRPVPARGTRHVRYAA